MRIKILKIKFAFKHLYFKVWRWNWDRKNKRIRRKFDRSLVKQDKILANLKSIKITE